MTKAKQSFENLNRAVNSLSIAVSTPPVEERDYAGIIQNFEFSYELFWKTLKWVLESNGIPAPFPRIAFEEAFKRGMISGNEIWKEMMEARNQTVHTYDPTLAHALYPLIKDKFLPELVKSVQLLKPYIS